MIQNRLSAGRDVTPMRSRANRNAPMMPGAGIGYGAVQINEERDHWHLQVGSCCGARRSPRFKWHSPNWLLVSMARAGGVHRQDGMSDPRQEIADLESEIDALTHVADRCRKAIVPGDEGGCAVSPDRSGPGRASAAGSGSRGCARGHARLLDLTRAHPMRSRPGSEHTRRDELS